MKHGDRIAAIFFLTLSLLVCGHALQVGVGTFQEPGPGLLVMISGAVLGLLSLWIFMLSLTSRSGRADRGSEGSPLGSGRFLALCTSLFVYAFAASWLGFLLSTLLFTAFVFRLVELEPWWRTLLKSLLITAGDYLIFVVWLKLSLPEGLLFG